MKNKIMIISSSEKSAWVSCQSITSNLQRSYQQVLPDAQYEFLPHHALSVHCLELAKKIKDQNPDKIIFLDHKPSVALFLKSLCLIYQQVKMPEILVHVYGDFILKTPDWLDLGPHLKTMKMKLICASKRQKDLVQSLFEAEGDLVHQCPFPVRKDQFYADDNLRKTGREKYGVGEELIFLYTGRISLQKNVVELARSFAEVLPSLERKAKLFIAGPFDDMGAPYLGLKTNTGSYQHKMMGLITELGLEEKVFYLGNHDKQSLIELYNLSDVFVSISTHNDEDYGMSPAEAMCSGLPLILSDWGGYTSFKQNVDFPHCDLIPVKFENYNVSPDLLKLKKQLILSSLLKTNWKQIEELAHQEFSDQSIAEKLKIILKEEPAKIKSFNNNLYRTASAISKRAKAPFASEIGKFSDFYQELYKVYWE